ncbi:MAG: nicotinate phosphoribosyltransferase [Actinobacteria bacterium]|nr:nicotinate phosphoribosyltransferase [Actinomycetota bacterium]
MTWVNDDNVALLTDLYELTMGASYHAHGMNDQATFDLFVRHLPDQRRFLICCGIEHALDYLDHLHFDDDAITYLRSLDMFEEGFLKFLSDLEFTGEVRAIPEGEAVFGGEPIISLTAPLIEAQIVETFLLNCIMFETMIASKAARVNIAARERRFVDFSLRRDQGADAGLRAARASFVGGAAATSNVLAGQMFGIPVNGTMAHSYVMAFEDELNAFRCFLRDFPEGSVLLIDTFDVEEGARRAARVAKELGPEGVTLSGVRIDSGDLATLTHSVRKILDEAQLGGVKIVLSGDLDEHRIEKYIADGVPVDAFGVGTQMGTSGDAPSLGGVYKLVEDTHGPKIKLSTGKATLPGRKQVFRMRGDGGYDHDVIALEDEGTPGGVPLLQQVMVGGLRCEERDPLTAVQARCGRTLALLPEELRSLDGSAEVYPVHYSPKLEGLIRRMQSEAG